jgi:COP9 signalosome complex subunit 6
MLATRITLLRRYLASLPPSYLSDAAIPITQQAPTNPSIIPLNHPILRSISALLARIPILAPPDTAAFTRETQEEQSDVQLVALLASMAGSVHAAKEIGRKFHIVESARYSGKKGLMMGMNMGGNLSMEDGQYFDTVMGGGSGRMLRERPPGY